MPKNQRENKSIVKVVINASSVSATDQKEAKLITNTRFEPIWWPVLSRSAYLKRNTGKGGVWLIKAL